MIKKYNFHSQGVKQLRAARILELEAYDTQLNGLMMQARGVAAQRKSALAALGGLQKIELSVAMTSSDKLHKFLDETAGHLIRKMPQGIPADIEEASDTMAEKARKMNEVMGAETSRFTQVIKTPSKYEGYREVIPTIRTPTACDYPTPSFLNQDGTRTECKASSKAGKQKCPIERCDVMKSREGLNAHIREVHTKEVILCPNLEYCLDPDGPKRTFNAGVMSGHFQKETALSPVLHQVLAVRVKEEASKQASGMATRGQKRKASAAAGLAQQLVKREPQEESIPEQK